jgi:UDP-N-acetylglucosamine 2-epimerase (non-hydrolysing)
MKKLLFIFGTRPEAIKTIPIIKEFKKFPTIYNVEVCITAQHREMLDSVMHFFEIEANYDLNIMKKNQSLFELTSRIVTRLEKVLDDCKPNMIFVHGDTTTTFAASLAAYYKQIDVAHIEAGLRTNDIYSPFPEEMNRQLVSKIAKYHFSPTEEAKNRLKSELIDEKCIYVVGNSVIDGLFTALNKIKNNKLIEENINNNINKQYRLSNKKFILITGHRRENFGSGFLNICDSILELSKKYPNFDFVYPVHLNPNVQTPVNQILGDQKNVYLINPLGYEEFIYLMSKCYLILTDSGGIQEEAPSLGKPVLVMRNNTERQEAIDNYTAKLVGTDKIIDNVSLLVDHENEYLKMSKALNPYGDGNTAKRIVEIINNVS